jgi:hypothetical protein
MYKVWHNLTKDQRISKVTLCRYMEDDWPTGKLKEAR